MDKAREYTSFRILTLPELTLHLKAMAFKMVVIGIRYRLNNIAIIRKGNFSYTANERYITGIYCVRSNNVQAKWFTHQEANKYHKSLKVQILHTTL